MLCPHANCNEKVEILIHGIINGNVLLSVPQFKNNTWSMKSRKNWMAI